MPNAPEISGQDSETTQVVVHNLAAELDAPDDVEVSTGEPAAPDSADAAPKTDVPPEDAAAKVDTKEVTVDQPAVDDTSVVDKPVDEVKEPTADQLEMIRLIRQMRKELSISNAKQQRYEEELRRLRQANTKPANDFDDDDLVGEGAAGKQPAAKEDAVPLSEIEQLQNELLVIGQQRSTYLATIAETMAVNPKYEDLKEVCSRNNLNDLIDAMAAKVAEDQGIDHVVAALKLENAIWKQPNPYLWMYETIKANHPRYAKQSQPQTTGQPNTPAPAPTAEKRQPKPAEAPASVMPLGPTDTSQGTGWTAAKLDAMDEMEFSKVPDNIRQKYLSGQL